jgi:hypothetical protein
MHAGSIMSENGWSVAAAPGIEPRLSDGRCAGLGEGPSGVAHNVSAQDDHI